MRNSTAVWERSPKEVLSYTRNRAGGPTRTHPGAPTAHYVALFNCCRQQQLGTRVNSLARARRAARARVNPEPVGRTASAHRDASDFLHKFDREFGTILNAAQSRILYPL